MKRIDEQAAFSNPQKYGEILSQLCRNIVKNMEKSELVKRIDEESAFSISQSHWLLKYEMALYWEIRSNSELVSQIGAQIQGTNKGIHKGLTCHKRSVSAHN